MFSYFTPEKQYGLTLAMLYVMTQSSHYILGQFNSFKNSRMSSKSYNSLVGLIYQKQLRLSAATNKDFK